MRISPNPKTKFTRLNNYSNSLIAVHSERDVGLESANIIGRSTCLDISFITSSENKSFTALKPEVK
jgi:hypothetical protein